MMLNLYGVDVQHSALIKKLGDYGLTDFQRAVLIETMKIPKGQTISYKELARRINHPNAYRAVGTALKKNPLPVKIPCHRVIRSNGSIGNYSGGGTPKKLALLLSEAKGKHLQKFKSELKILNKK
jgi:O-6-methylguanine DNA methyltransferase